MHLIVINPDAPQEDVRLYLWLGRHVWWLVAAYAVMCTWATGACLRLAQFINAPVELQAEMAAIAVVVFVGGGSVCKRCLGAKLRQMRALGWVVDLPPGHITNFYTDAAQIICKLKPRTRLAQERRVFVTLEVLCRQHALLAVHGPVVEYMTIVMNIYDGAVQALAALKLRLLEQEEQDKLAARQQTQRATGN